MVKQTLARRYAIAIATLAREQHAVERVSDDLQAIGDSIGAPGLIRDFFESPVIDRPSKELALRTRFRGQGASDRAARALAARSQAAREVARPRSSPNTSRWNVRRAAWSSLTLETARPLDPAERDRLMARLEAVYGKKFEVKEIVDPTLIGGLRLMMGDRRIDASISGRLDALARELSHAS